VVRGVDQLFLGVSDTFKCPMLLQFFLRKQQLAARYVRWQPQRHRPPTLFRFIIGIPG